MLLVLQFQELPRVSQIYPTSCFLQITLMMWCACRPFSHCLPECFCYQTQKGLQQIYIFCFFHPYPFHIKLEASVFLKKRHGIVASFTQPWTLQKQYFQEQYFQEQISENDQKGMMSCLVACVHSAAFKKTRVHATTWAGYCLVHNPIYNYLGSHTVIWKPFALRLPGLIRALSLKRSFAFVGGIWLVNFQLIQNFMGIVDGSGSVPSGLL